jgi:hypothetical protein
MSEVFVCCKNNIHLVYTSKKTQQRILHPLAQEFAVVIGICDSYLHSRAVCFNGFIQVIKLTDELHIVLVGAIVGPLDVI